MPPEPIEHEWRNGPRLRLMNQSKIPFFILIGLLFFAGLGLTWHRHVTFQIPWVPGEKQKVWSVEARVEFQASGDPVLISLAVPQTQSGYELISEYTASPGYGLAFVERENARRAEWSIRSAEGPQVLYYRAELTDNKNITVAQELPEFGVSGLLLGSGPEITVAKSLLFRAQQRSANVQTLTRELVREFNQNDEAVFLLEKFGEREDWMVALLQQANINVRRVSVLELEDGRRRSPLKNYLQIYDGEEYFLVDPSSSEPLNTIPQLMWEYHSQPVLDVLGGRDSTVTFSVLEKDIPVNDIVAQRRHAFTELVDFSIHLLPLSEQALFRGILLIPIGVLVVCFFRILVGMRTAGTFMPVLIAIAFIQTSLVTGLVGFVLIVGVGLLIRGYLSQLNLLLVARISTVILSVIILITMLAVLSYRLGLTEGLKISFFPMIILSWTIERMSILWEEEGGEEVFVQVGGSLFTAVITYALMMNSYVQHLTFNFLGLQLVFMAMILLLGTYTGYRLFELHRFYALVKRK